MLNLKGGVKNISLFFCLYRKLVIHLQSNIKTINLKKMKRQELLSVSFSQEKNQEVLVEEILAKDNKFIKREIRRLEDKIEDLEEEFNARLKSQEPLDSATITVLFAGIKEAKKTLELYKEFKKEYLNE